MRDGWRDNTRPHLSHSACLADDILPGDTNSNKISHLLKQSATPTIHQLPPDSRLRRIVEAARP